MAEQEIPWFRRLYEEILDYEGNSLFSDLLTPWIEKAQPAIAQLSQFKTFSKYDPKDESAQDAMWNLYALSRVSDQSLTALQGVDEPDHSGARFALDEYVAFFRGCGFTVVETDCFSPFHHEIVRVQQSDDDDQAIGIYRRIWPGLMFGEMMFSRSGVEVVGGRRHIVKEIAERSTLYFTYRRLRRRTNDLSMGWGSNSQWRTSFRRDYQMDGKRIYNADGKNLLNTGGKNAPVDDGLTFEERIELCRHRCFVVTSKEDDDLYPFHDRYEEPCDR